MTDNSSTFEDEHSKLTSILNFRFPHEYKKIGLLGALTIFLFLLASKFFGDFGIVTKDVLRTLILLFLLVASLSKDKLEDEYNRHVRHQSFVVAFVFAASYAILIPLIAIILDFAITKITGDGSVNFYKISAFEVLFILMGMQLLFFETLKKYGSCETD